MRALVTLEDHLWRQPDGGVYVNSPDGYGSWSELLEVFDEVLLSARLRETTREDPSGLRIDGPSVSVHGLPDYSGPWGFLGRLSELMREVRSGIAKCDAYFLRVPGLIGYVTWRELKRTRKSYAVEVVGDPWEALGPGSLRSALRFLYRRITVREMKAICGQADAALYCGRRNLRCRYPPASGAHTAVSPRVILSEGYASPNVISDRLRRVDDASGAASDVVPELRVGFIGSLAQLYKGPDVLLRAAALCAAPRLPFRVYLVGEGRYRSAMESLARRLSIQERVVFVGKLGPGKPIFDFLDSMDLFVMPSRAEAFGRALLEAMARGCHCIGSDVGEIPELLADEDVFRSGDPESLAAKMKEVMAKPERLKHMSRRNLEKAKEFNPHELRAIRQEFYRFVKSHLD